MTLESKLQELRVKWKEAGTLSKDATILKRRGLKIAVEKYKKEYGVSSKKGLWDDDFKTAFK